MINAYQQLPQVIGHRGACGSAPENTLASIHEAGRQGARWVEIDIVLSADHVPMIFHDETLNRCTDGAGSFYKQNHQQLKMLDAGSWYSSDFIGQSIPTLKEAIEVIAQYNMGLNLEIKPLLGLEVETATRAIEVLKESWPPHLPLLLSSFNIHALKTAEALWPEVQRGLNVEVIPFNWQERLAEANCSGLHIHFPFFESEIVQQIRQDGYEVLAFTVNTPADAIELIQNGLSAVFTDYPELIQQALEENQANSSEAVWGLDLI